MVLSGAPSSLQNGPVAFDYLITKATGVYASGVGQHGQMELHLSTTVGANHKAPGQFSLVKWIPS